MSEASVPSEVTLISGGYITAQSPSLGSVIISVTENKGSLRGGDNNRGTGRLPPRRTLD